MREVGAAGHFFDVPDPAQGLVEPVFAESCARWHRLHPCALWPSW
jgi:hypothetical protein